MKSFENMEKDFPTPTADFRPLDLEYSHCRPKKSPRKGCSQYNLIVVKTEARK